MDNEIKGILESIKNFLDLHYDDIIKDSDGNYQLYIKKAFIGKVNDFKITLYPNDHGNPDHFHVISKQRSLNFRLNLYTLEPLQGENISSKDLTKIQFMLKFSPNLHKKLLTKYQEFHPSSKI